MKQFAKKTAILALIYWLYIPAIIMYLITFQYKIQGSYHFFRGIKQTLNIFNPKEIIEFYGSDSRNDNLSLREYITETMETITIFAYNR